MVEHKSKPKFKPGKANVEAADAVKPLGDNYRIKGRVWIAGPEETFLGFGRIVLLERIKEHGSITKAASSMSMSYRHAWELVDSMNRQSPQPLVSLSVGGTGGGGAKLTPAGEQMISDFHELHARFKQFLDNLQTELKFFAK